MGNRACACLYRILFSFTFSHLADAIIQSDLQMRTMEAIIFISLCLIIFVYVWFELHYAFCYFHFMWLVSGLCIIKNLFEETG